MKLMSFSLFYTSISDPANILVKKMQSFSLKERKQAIVENFVFIDRLDSWAAVDIENHDRSSSITRFGDDSPKYRKTSAKLLALLERALTGTLYIYLGQELRTG